MLVSKKRESLLWLLMGRHTIVVCSKSTIGRNDKFASTNAFRHFALGPSPLSLNVRLFSPSTLKLSMLLRVSSQQYVLLHKRNLSVHRISSLNKPRFTFIMFFVVSAIRPGRKIAASVCSELTISLFL